VHQPTALPNPDLPIQPGGNPDLWTDLLVVETQVQNTGNVESSTVLQLYVSFPDTAPSGTPIRQLRGFEKVYITPGASADVRIVLRRRDLSYWDVTAQSWIIPQGNFAFSGGFSSRDLRSVVQLNVLGF
jgi:beta-glucosidase